MSEVKEKQVYRSKKDITKELIEREMVDEETKKRDLQMAIFDLSKTYSFFGAVMQCMNITYTHILPTAGVQFNSDLKRWDMFLNPFFFCKKLTSNQRIAVLLHEIYHISHKHPFRLNMSSLPSSRRELMNIAMDMSINQYIKGLPNGCDACKQSKNVQTVICTNELCPGHAIDITSFYDEVDDKKIAWDKLQPAEYYYQKLLTKLTDNDGNNSDSVGNLMSEVPLDALGSDNSTIDVHDWNSSVEEKDMLDATEELMKRAMIKENFSFDKLPGSVKELLQYIEKRNAELNYKAIIMMAMKLSLPSNTRKYTWSRKSRRFGSKAPGTTVGSQPKLEIFIDTSGSISITEANQFLDIIDEFLKVGAKQCHLNMFHTSNYYSKPYKLGERIKEGDFQMGGTCLKDSMSVIAKKRPDLSIFLTDGYFCDVNVESIISRNDKFPKTVFIISKNGNVKHPFTNREWARTVKIPN